MKKLNLTYKQGKDVLWNGKTIRVSRSGSVYYVSTDYEGFYTATDWTGKIFEDLKITSEFDDIADYNEKEIVAVKVEEFTKEEIYIQLKSIGTVNTSEEQLVNILTGEKASLRITDNDRHYFWILEQQANMKYQVTYSASIF